MTDSEGRGFTRLENGDIQIRLTKEDFDCLLLSLGYAFGSLHKIGDLAMTKNVLRVVNRINQGNPDFTEYETTDRLPSKRSEKKPWLQEK